MKFTGPPCNGQKVSDKKTDMTFELPDKNNRVYIVGADSYFGAHFAKYWLENGIEVHGCGCKDNLPDELREIKYSKSDYSVWELCGLDYDWIMVCLDPTWKMDAYLSIIQSLCNYLESNHISTHVCYLSSFRVCDSNSRHAILETSRLMPHSEYEMNIAAAELYLRMRSFQMNGRLPVRIVRMGEVYGNEFGANGDHTYPGLINESLRQASVGESVVMYGLGLKKWTVTHVSDACRFSIKYMNLDFAPEIINVPGETLCVADVLMNIARHFHADSVLASASQNSVFCNKFAGDQVLSCKSARQLIAYEPQCRFRQWLARQQSLMQVATLA